MRFTRLRISGFKSFGGPAELTLAPGLTGIVGSNGCGKSNIVEALRWVLGEASAEGLRSDEIIFGGTAIRPAFDLAEVTLGLECRGGEVEVARRIGRGVGSTYRRDGREVPARAVRFLFSDAGAGAHSPAVIGQGQIGFIVEAGPEERRRLLEDAAGIGGLHARRREAESRLDAARANVARLEDQAAALRGRVGVLERQANEAERYKALQAESRRIEALSALATLDGAVAALGREREDCARLEERLRAAEAETRRRAEAGAAIGGPPR